MLTSPAEMATTPLPTDKDVAGLTWLSTEDIADLYGISTHALHMRLRRPGAEIPAPHHKMGRCLIWILTAELADKLGMKGHL